MDASDNLSHPNRKLSWYPDWNSGYGDYVIKPDLSTFGVVPWLDRTGAVIGDVYDQTTGCLLETAPRALLKKLVAKADSLGYRIQAALELEFIIFAEPVSEIASKGYTAIKKLAPGVYNYSLYRLSVHQELLQSIVQNMNLRGIPIHSYQMEAGPGQFEVQLAHTDALEAADRAFIYKSGVKEIVARHGMTATFMAKFDAAELGSSCHVHQSLWEKRTGRSLFWDSKGEHRISQAMRNYAAGLLEVLPDFTLMWAPYVNSYKRLGKNTAAGLNKTWGIDNRTVSIRVLPESEDSCRLEHRVPGADANPYLVMAAMLAGGLYGIENALDPPHLVVGNAYDIPAKDAPQVPRTLGDAVACFMASPLTREFFGEKFVEYYAEFKAQEWNQFCSCVTDWEIKKYLEMA
jgi:glutamine synthetase